MLPGATRDRSRLARPRMDGIEYLLWRQTLADGHATTVYAVRHPRATTRVRVAHFPRDGAARRLVRGERRRRGDHRRVLRARPVPAARRALDRWPRGPRRAGRTRLRGGAGLRGGRRRRVDSLPRASAPPSRRATSSRPGLSSSATARWCSTGSATRGLLVRLRPVRLRHHGRAPSARRARPLGRALRRRRLRRPPVRVDGGLDLAELATVMLELGAHSRSTSTGAARRPSCTAGISSTAPTRRRTSRLPSRGPSSALCSSSRASSARTAADACGRRRSARALLASWATTPAHGRERGESRGGHERRARHDRRAGRLVHRRRLHRRRRRADTRDTSHREPASTSRRARARRGTPTRTGRRSTSSRASASRSGTAARSR